MIDGIEALIALERTGTISEAAAQLRLTQSAISKRLQALNLEVGFSLIEPHGRRVRLTSRGLIFLEKARPLVLELKNLKYLREQAEFSRFSIGLSDSVAASWGPKLIKRVMKKLKTLDLDLHVHRSILLQEHVKLGRYHFGLCTSPADDNVLVSSLVVDEPMVIVASEFKDRVQPSQAMITIEKGSSTWKSVGLLLEQHPRLKNHGFSHVESFAAAVQMAREGFGNAVVPIGLARAMHIPSGSTHSLSPVVKRGVHLISRKNISLLPVAQEFQKTLQVLAKEMFQTSFS